MQVGACYRAKEGALRGGDGRKQLRGGQCGCEAEQRLPPDEGAGAWPGPLGHAKNVGLSPKRSGTQLKSFKLGGYSDSQCPGQIRNVWRQMEHVTVSVPVAA